MYFLKRLYVQSNKKNLYIFPLSKANRWKPISKRCKCSENMHKSRSISHKHLSNKTNERGKVTTNECPDVHNTNTAVSLATSISCGTADTQFSKVQF